MATNIEALKPTRTKESSKSAALEGIVEDIVPLPTSLEALSSDEIQKLGTITTRKLDMIVMPALMWLYVLYYIDRQNLSSSRLAGTMEDLDMTVTQYNAVVSILFAGYILMQVPSNLLISKIRYPALYICACVATWGVVSACTAAVKSFSGLLICRFFLGFIEAAFFPGAAYYISTLYTRKQIALRLAIYYCGSQIGDAFGPLFALAILQLNGRAGIVGWRWLFLIEGILTIGFALIFALYLPNSQKKIITLSKQQHDWLQWNYESDQRQQDHGDEITASKAFWLAVSDPKTWLLMGIQYSINTAGSVENFFPVVVGTFGFSQTLTYVLSAPPFILSIFYMLSIGFHSDKKQE